MRKRKQASIYLVVSNTLFLGRTQGGKTHTQGTTPNGFVFERPFMTRQRACLNWLCLLSRPPGVVPCLHGVPAWLHQACTTNFAVSLTLYLPRLLATSKIVLVPDWAVNVLLPPASSFRSFARFCAKPRREQSKVGWSQSPRSRPLRLQVNVQGMGVCTHACCRTQEEKYAVASDCLPCSSVPLT
jgi:hypothetical protein